MGNGARGLRHLGATDTRTTSAGSTVCWWLGRVQRRVGYPLVDHTASDMLVAVIRHSGALRLRRLRRARASTTGTAAALSPRRAGHRTIRRQVVEACWRPDGRPSMNYGLLWAVPRSPGGSRADTRRLQKLRRGTGSALPSALHPTVAPFRRGTATTVGVFLVECGRLPSPRQPSCLKLSCCSLLATTRSP